jgi:hypothetical protein
MLLLRLPDRWVPTKPAYAERINPFPTTVDFRADKTVAMGEQCSPLHGAVQTSASYLRYAKRHGFVSSFDTGQPEITVSVGAVKRL